MSQKIISLEYLSDIAQGDKKFMVDMIDLFLKHICDVSVDLNAAIAENRSSDFFNIIHKFKTSANLFQLTDVVDLIVAFELKKSENLTIHDFEKTKENLLHHLNESKPLIIQEKQKLLTELP